MAPAARFTHDEEESLVLKASSKCVSESSLLDFKMSSIAKHAGVSIGSVYKHVRSKEDVLVALASCEAKTMLTVITTVMTSAASSPERLIAALLIDPFKVQTRSYALHLEMLISNQDILRKASKTWLDKLAEVEHNIQTVFKESFLHSSDFLAEAGEREKTVEELMVGIWSMHVGFKQVCMHRNALYFCEDSIPLPFPLATNHSLIRNAQLLINSYSWEKPLTAEDIEQTAMRLQELGYR